jgi:hypothetical protein
VSTFQSGGKCVVACRDVSERVACEDNIHRELANYQKLLAEIMPVEKEVSGEKVRRYSVIA